MDYERLHDEIERHWRVVFEDNEVGVGDEKSILHAKRWYVYIDNKRSLIKACYYVEVSYSDGKKVIWKVLDKRVVEEPK